MQRIFNHNAISTPRLRYSLLLTVVLGLLVATIATTDQVAANSSEPQQIEQAAPTDLVIAHVNEQRAAHGCPALVANPLLAVAAQRHAEDMAVRDYLHHTNPEGLTFGQRITNAGYAWNKAAENIAVGVQDPAAIVALWMQSPTHRAAILDCELTEVAVGWAYQGNDLNNVRFPDGSVGGPFYNYWVMDMALPAR